MWRLYQKNAFMAIVYRLWWTSIEFPILHVSLQNRLLSESAILSMKIPRLKIWNGCDSASLITFPHSSVVSFNSSFRIKSTLAKKKRFHKNPQQEEVHPTAPGTAPPIQPRPHLTAEAAVWHSPPQMKRIPCFAPVPAPFCPVVLIPRVPLLHLYAKHTDEAATYH